MNVPDRLDDGRAEGERRKDAAHSLLAARRQAYVRRARRALLSQLLFTGAATADDVAELVGPLADGIDPRFLGTVPGPLAESGIIHDTGKAVKSSRPVAHALRITVWELADRAAALAWLDLNPDLPEPGDAGTPCPSTLTPPSPAPITVATHQQSPF